jgi:Xaa-Pro aminopeptidase
MSADRRHERLEGLARALQKSNGAEKAGRPAEEKDGEREEESLDALLITSRANIRYLTGFSGSAALVVVSRADVLLVTDFRYDGQAQAEAGAVARVVVDRTSVWERLFKELPALGPLKRVGFEPHALTVREAERLRASATAARPWRWCPAGELVEQLRVRKDPAEIDAIRAAAQVAGEAFRCALAGVRPGLSELEVAGILEGHLRRLGSEGHPFPTIVASGPRSALPHARSSRRTIERGEWLLLDFGAMVDGYCADITRTVVVGGRATDAQRALYELVRSAQQRARAGVRPGMTGAEADALARDVIDAKGFADAFGHSTGHGLGLEVHEAPRLSRTNESPLPVDAVVTIEPGVYLIGQGGVRIEDDVHLSSEGPVLLSDGKTELIEVL